MRSPLPYWILAASVALSGCCTAPTSELGIAPEDPQVAAKCAPVRSLLSKNFRGSANAGIPFFKFGGLYDRNGTVLDPADAYRIAHVDAACRLWVQKEITGKEYAQIVLGRTSAAIVQTTTPGERDEVIASVVKAFEQLKGQGLLPASFDTSKVPEKVAADSQLTQQQLESSLKIGMAGLEDKVVRLSSRIGGDDLHGIVMTKLDDIERAVAKLGAPAPVPVPPTPPTPPNDDSSSKRAGDEAANSGPTATPTPGDFPGLDVYFATSSSELIFSERARISRAAAIWVQSRVRINVFGSYDPRGGREYNLKLARARADAVVAVLANHGVTIGKVASGEVDLGSSNYDKLRAVRMCPETDSPRSIP